MIFPNDTIQVISEFLFLETPIEVCEIAIVFGNEYLQTMDTVKSLYEQGMIKEKIILSGHSVHKDREPEALRFRNYGSKLGIPDSAMLIEPDSTNTYENLLYTRQVIETQIRPVSQVRSIMFIAKAFVTRRIQMTVHTLFPDHIKYVYCPIVDKKGRNIGRDCWWESSTATQRVFEEIKRIAEYSLKGDLSIGLKDFKPDNIRDDDQTIGLGL